MRRILIAASLLVSSLPLTAQEPPSVCGLIWGDIDRDGREDALVIGPQGGLQLFANRGEGRLEDVTARSGLDLAEFASCALFSDFDGDGLSDLFLGSAEQRLWRNLGEGAFQPFESGLEHDLVDLEAVALDHDADGQLDLHLHTEAGDVFYRNVGRGRFERVVLPGADHAAPLGAVGSDSEDADSASSGAGASPARRRYQRWLRERARRTSSSAGGGGAPSSLAAGPVMSATNIGNLPLAALPSMICAGTIVDQATMQCIEASSNSALGKLHPLSTNFFVDSATGRVGIGTSTPSATLNVVSSAAGDTVVLPGLKLRNTAGAPNVLGGATNNTIGASVTGGTIGGGELHNVVGSNGTIAGGYQNYAAQQAGVVSGAANSANGFRSFIGGGYANSAQVGHATVAGGYDNDAIGTFAFIGGGEFNEIDLGTTHATIAGGKTNLGRASFATIGGGEDNQVLAAYGTIGGGGPEAVSVLTGNRVYDNYGTVGGGTQNRAGGNDGDPANSPWATVAGGERNDAYAAGSSVGGGGNNDAGGPYSAVSGGFQNSALGHYSTVCGGAANEALGPGSTVCGGQFNRAAGFNSWAGGVNAKADHDSAFVWADGSVGGFLSTSPNQFLVRATGGVGINTNAPSVKLHVEGGNDAGPTGGGYVQCGPTNGNNVAIDDNEIMARSNGATSALSLQQDGGHLLIGAGSGGSTNVGINTNSPSVELHVTGGNDAGPTGGGYFQCGPSNANNVAIDDNEILARSNGATSALFLQQDGGNLIVGANSGGTVQVAIGTNSPSTFMLAVNGTAAKPGGGSWSVFSDARLKTNVEALDGALDDLLALRGVTFEYADREHFSYVEGQQTGFIAQEVEKVFPQWVNEDEQGFKSLSITGFEALTVEALRELREENQRLRDELTELRAAVKALVGEEGAPARR